MSDIRNWTKEFLTEFINIYREEPCLWKIKDKSVYTNRNLKTIAYNRLAEYSKTVYPEANRTWVVNRIQSLRGSFRKEFNKWYETKNKSGSSADNVHIPSLWYYNQLIFTKEQEMPEESISNISDDESNVSITENAQEQIFNENKETIYDDNLSTVKETSTVPEPYFAVKTQKKRKKDDQQLFVKTITQAIQSCKDVDEFEAFGICVAAKVRKMSETQFLMAEPLINSILSKGLLNNLTPDTVIDQKNSFGYSHNQVPPPPSTINSDTTQSNITATSSTLSYSHPDIFTSPDINHSNASLSNNTHTYTDCMTSTYPIYTNLTEDVGESGIDNSQNEYKSSYICM